MGYVLTAVISDGDAGLPWTHVELPQGFRLWPLWETRIDHLYGVSGPGEVLDGFIYLTESVALDLKNRAGSSVAWIEAEFFGGVGEQAAVGWDRSGTPLGPFTGAGGPGDPGAIDQVLRLMGVEVGDDLDEFAALGLGRHRRVESWLDTSVDEVMVLLRSVDDGDRAERPWDFDRDAAEGRLVGLRDLLTSRFGVVPEGEWGFPTVQDASHFGQLAFRREAIPEGVAVWVRVSSWGRLATFGAENPGVFDDDELREHLDESYLGIRDDLDVAGYDYVPEWLLMTTPYDGSNTAIRRLPVDGGATWWTRYFDYL